MRTQNVGEIEHRYESDNLLYFHTQGQFGKARVQRSTFPIGHSLEPEKRNSLPDYELYDQVKNITIF